MDVYRFLPAPPTSAFLCLSRALQPQSFERLLDGTRSRRKQLLVGRVGSPLPTMTAGDDTANS